MTAPLTEPEAQATVRALLRAAGLKPSEEEIAQFVQMYPAMRETADKLYFDAVRYEQPALIYAAEE